MQMGSGLALKASPPLFGSDGLEQGTRTEGAAESSRPQHAPMASSALSLLLERPVKDTGDVSCSVARCGTGVSHGLRTAHTSLSFHAARPQQELEFHRDKKAASAGAAPSFSLGLD